tara:strand:- start:1729 stop:1947 length:219 start_codon:yes stop_codon:yes gene_type:complete
MKYEIDSKVLKVTKDLILSELQTAKENYNRETDFDRKAMIEASINNLRKIYNNLADNANKPKPIRKMGIGSK